MKLVYFASSAYAGSFGPYVTISPQGKIFKDPLLVFMDRVRYGICQSTPFREFEFEIPCPCKKAYEGQTKGAKCHAQSWWIILRMPHLSCVEVGFAFITHLQRSQCSQVNVDSLVAGSQLIFIHPPLVHRHNMPKNSTQKKILLLLNLPRSTPNLNSLNLDLA